MKTSVIDISYLRAPRSKDRPVAYYNLAGTYLGAYPSVAKAAAILNTTSAAITKSSTDGSRAGNYLFSIADADGNVPFRLTTTNKVGAASTNSAPSRPIIGGQRTTKKQPIIQYRNGVKVARFESIAAAAAAVHGSSSNISEAARRVTDSKGSQRSTAYGYTWRFETEADRQLASKPTTGCGSYRAAA